ncbi:MAG: restriction endonuclease subunit S [Desulfobulbus oligotrophicus]|jgi:type I restriction enzyme S subunit|nr:restriction endonuclease subunit S [Desulfobulbus oligotrophicus]
MKSQKTRIQYVTSVTPLQVDPSKYDEQQVVHYSIPVIQETGLPGMELASEIASNKWLLKGGEVLVSKLNVHKNCVAIVGDHANETVFASTEFVAFTPHAIEQRFLKYIFQSEETIQQLSSLSESATRSHARVNPSDIIKLKAYQPPLKTQRLIADYLDRETARIDALVTEKEKMLTLLEEKRAALISRAVTRDLDPTAPLKPSGLDWLGDIPAHWEILPIKYVATVGNGSTPTVDNSDYWDDEGFPWMNSSVVNMEVVTGASRGVTDKALKECHLPIISPPAVLVGITGQGKTRGMASILMRHATINQHLAYLKPQDGRLLAEYLRFVLAGC